MECCTIEIGLPQVSRSAQVVVTEIRFRQISVGKVNALKVSAA
jgi:hypothetical protein